MFLTLITTLLLSHACLAADTAFAVDFNWNLLNYTWNSAVEYQTAITNRTYIPENTFMVGIKFFRSTLYIAMPRVRPGAPVTMGTVSAAANATRKNPLIAPFPSWESNRIGDCSHLLNVQSMEIDKNGTMWVIDGIRITPSVSGNCPSKLVLFDLTKNNSIIHVYNFPEALSAAHGGSLNDIVIDDTDGDFAYISDISSDPGIIAYSRKTNRAWKLHTGSTDGIALTPRAPGTNIRTVYYCDINGVILNSLDTNFLKNESLASGESWKLGVRFVGLRQSRSDGLIIDNTGDLYYGVIDLFGIGRWNIHRPFSEAKVIDVNRQAIIWPDSFAIDEGGNVNILTNHVDEYFDVSRKINTTDEPRFRILKLHTGTRSYLYPNLTQHGI